LKKGKIYISDFGVEEASEYSDNTLSSIRNIVDNGNTPSRALGSVLQFTLSMVEQFQMLNGGTSQVVVISDGMCNDGINRLDSVEQLDNNFYKDLGAKFLSCHTSVSFALIPLKEELFSLEHLTVLPSLTSGTIRYANLLSCYKEPNILGKILKKKLR